MNGLLIHSGGPSPVINASLAGLVEEARLHREVKGLFGARHGIEGLLQEKMVDLLHQPADLIRAIGSMPSSALGTSRKDANDSDLLRVVQICQERAINCIFVNGGNGSLGMAEKLAEMGGGSLQVIGIPKTIDNDLLVTDHSPGYPTAARFFACAIRDIGADNRALPGQVEFVEVLGRNAGWLVAATSLARSEPDDAPHLIYFPEQPLPLQKLLDDISEVYQRLGRCVVAICEGQLDENGEAFGADERGGSRGKLAMNLAHRLAMLTTEKLKLRARSEKPGLLGRCFWSEEPALDRIEARLCGAAALRAAVGGQTGVSVVLTRGTGDSYEAATNVAPLSALASKERLFPAAWRNQAGTDVTASFHQYAKPLIGEIESYSRLQGY